MSKLYYLRGALGDSHLLAEHQKAISELLSGCYTEKNLEKLKGHEVYSFRTSQESRLLFSLCKFSGKTYLIVLDYLPNHEYDKSRFLQSGVLKRFLEKHAAEYEHQAEEGLIFEVMDAPQRQAIEAAQPASGEETHYIELDYYQQHFIELNVNQQEAIKVPLPAVISGIAGSGKSCVASSLLTSYLSAHSADEAALPLLYVSKSRPLVQMLETMWRELPLAQAHPERIEFKTYDALLPEAVRGELKGEDDFHEWYLKHVTHQRKVAQATKQEVPELDAAAAYQELRIASAYDKATYLGLGKHQSSVPKEQRLWLYTLLEDYTVSLERRVDSALYRWESDKRYALIVVDEAQDLSHLQLVLLGKMAQEHSIVYCLDNHQRLFDRRSVRPFLLEHFRIGEQSHIELNVTYRCPVKVVAAANAVIAFKHRLAGGIGDKLEATHMISEGKGLGHLYVLNPEQLKEQPWLLAQTPEPYCAIITAKEFLEEARVYFNTPLVFTPEEIKGLEYSIIIAYKLYNPELFYEAQKRITELGDKKSSPVRRPKSGSEDERFGPALNQIYTAYTRAQQLLVLCEESVRHYDLLLRPLSQLANKEPLSADCLSLQECHQRDWEEQVRIQLDAGNEAIALAIFITKLGGVPDAFPGFVARYRAVLSPTGLSPLASVADEVVPIQEEGKVLLSKGSVTDDCLEQIRTLLPTYEKNFRQIEKMFAGLVNRAIINALKEKEVRDNLIFDGALEQFVLFSQEEVSVYCELLKNIKTARSITVSDALRQRILKDFPNLRVKGKDIWCCVVQDANNKALLERLAHSIPSTSPCLSYATDLDMIRVLLSKSPIVIQDKHAVFDEISKRIKSKIARYDIRLAETLLEIAKALQIEIPVLRTEKLLSQSYLFKRLAQKELQEELGRIIKAKASCLFALFSEAAAKHHAPLTLPWAVAMVSTKTYLDEAQAAHPAEPLPSYWEDIDDQMKKQSAKYPGKKKLTKEEQESLLHDLVRGSKEAASILLVYLEKRLLHSSPLNYNGLTIREIDLKEIMENVFSAKDVFTKLIQQIHTSEMLLSRRSGAINFTKLTLNQVTDLIKSRDFSAYIFSSSVYQQSFTARIKELTNAEPVKKDWLSFFNALFTLILTELNHQDCFFLKVMNYLIERKTPSIIKEAYVSAVRQIDLRVLVCGFLFTFTDEDSIKTVYKFIWGLTFNEKNDLLKMLLADDFFMDLSLIALYNAKDEAREWILRTLAGLGDSATHNYLFDFIRRNIVAYSGLARVMAQMDYHSMTDSVIEAWACAALNACAYTDAPNFKDSIVRVKKNQNFALPSFISVIPKMLYQGKALYTTETLAWMVLAINSFSIGGTTENAITAVKTRDQFATAELAAALIDKFNVLKETQEINAKYNEALMWLSKAIATVCNSVSELDSTAPQRVSTFYSAPLIANVKSILNRAQEGIDADALESIMWMLFVLFIPLTRGMQYLKKKSLIDVTFTLSSQEESEEVRVTVNAEKILLPVPAPPEKWQSLCDLELIHLIFDLLRTKIEYKPQNVLYCAGLISCALTASRTQGIELSIDAPFLEKIRLILNKLLLNLDNKVILDYSYIILIELALRSDLDFKKEYQDMMRKVVDKLIANLFLITPPTLDSSLFILDGIIRALFPVHLFKERESPIVVVKVIDLFKLGAQGEMSLFIADESDRAALLVSKLIYAMQNILSQLDSTFSHKDELVEKIAMVMILILMFAPRIEQADVAEALKMIGENTTNEHTKNTLKAVLLTFIKAYPTQKSEFSALLEEISSGQGVVKAVEQFLLSSSPKLPFIFSVLTQAKARDEVGKAMTAKASSLFALFSEAIAKHPAPLRFPWSDVIPSIKTYLESQTIESAEPLPCYWEDTDDRIKKQSAKYSAEKKLAKEEQESLVHDFVRGSKEAASILLVYLEKGLLHSSPLTYNGLAIREIDLKGVLENSFSVKEVLAKLVQQIHVSETGVMKKKAAWADINSSSMTLAQMGELIKSRDFAAHVLSSFKYRLFFLDRIEELMNEGSAKKDWFSFFNIVFTLILRQLSHQDLVCYLLGAVNQIIKNETPSTIKEAYVSAVSQIDLKVLVCGCLFTFTEEDSIKTVYKFLWRLTFHAKKDLLKMLFADDFFMDIHLIALYSAKNEARELILRTVSGLVDSATQNRVFDLIRRNRIAYSGLARIMAQMDPSMTDSAKEAWAFAALNVCAYTPLPNFKDIARVERNQNFALPSFISLIPKMLYQGKELYTIETLAWMVAVINDYHIVETRKSAIAAVKTRDQFATAELAAALIDKFKVLKQTKEVNAKYNQTLMWLSKAIATVCNSVSEVDNTAPQRVNTFYSAPLIANVKAILNRAQEGIDADTLESIMWMLFALFIPLSRGMQYLEKNSLIDVTFTLSSQEESEEVRVMVNAEKFLLPSLIPEEKWRSLCDLEWIHLISDLLKIEYKPQNLLYCAGLISFVLTASRIMGIKLPIDAPVLEKIGHILDKLLLNLDNKVILDYSSIILMELALRSDLDCKKEYQDRMKKIVDKLIANLFLITSPTLDSSLFILDGMIRALLPVCLLKERESVTVLTRVKPSDQEEKPIFIADESDRVALIDLPKFIFVVDKLLSQLNDGFSCREELIEKIAILMTLILEIKPSATQGVIKILNKMGDNAMSERTKEMVKIAILASIKASPELKPEFSDLLKKFVSPVVVKSEGGIVRAGTSVFFKDAAEARVEDSEVPVPILK